jgi:hypothetical protein
MHESSAVLDITLMASAEQLDQRLFYVCLSIGGWSKYGILTIETE